MRFLLRLPSLLWLDPADAILFQLVGPEPDDLTGSLLLDLGSSDVRPALLAESYGYLPDDA